MTHPRRSLVLLVVLCLVPLLWALPAWATHGTWHDHYTDAHGLLCCSQGLDCVPQPVRILQQSATTVTVEINGTPVDIPQASLHLSEDTRDWVCWRTVGYGKPHVAPRCVFVAPGT